MKSSQLCSIKRYDLIFKQQITFKKEVQVNHVFIHSSQYNTIWFLNCIEKTPKFFCSLHYRQSKNPAKASVNPFIIEEAVAGTSTVAPLEDINIDFNNLIGDIDPIGAVPPSIHERPVQQKYQLKLFVIQIEVPGIRA